MTTDLPICAKSADNGALIVFSLRKRGYCDTKITGKAGTGTGRAACFDYTQLEEFAASHMTLVMHEKTGLGHINDFSSATIQCDCYTNCACTAWATLGQRVCLGSA